MTRTIGEQLPPLGFVGLAWGASAVAAARLPARVPLHWNAAGEVDRTGSPYELLWFVPILVTAAWALTAALPWLDATGNLRASRAGLAAIRTSTVGILAVVHLVTLAAAGGVVTEPLPVALAAVGVLLAALGNALGKIRPNGIAGVRTPWTLASARSWNATNRAGGWAMVGLGLAEVIAAVTLPGIGAVVTLIAGAGALVTGLLVYSWWMWRTDPDPVPFDALSPDP